MYRLAWCSVIRAVHDFPTALLMPQSCSCHTGRPRSATRCQLLHWSIIYQLDASPTRYPGAASGRLRRQQIFTHAEGTFTLPVLLNAAVSFRQQARSLRCVYGLDCRNVHYSCCWLTATAFEDASRFHLSGNSGGPVMVRTEGDAVKTNRNWLQDIKTTKNHSHSRRRVLRTPSLWIIPRPVLTGRLHRSADDSRRNVL